MSGTVASGASMDIDATVAASSDVEGVSTTDNNVEAVKVEEPVAVEKDTKSSDGVALGIGEKKSDAKATVTSNSASEADGTENNKNAEEKKVQKGQKVTGNAKRRKGKKPAATVAQPTAVDDKKEGVNCTPGDDKKEGERADDKKQGEAGLKLTPGDDKDAEAGAELATGNDKKEGELGTVASSNDKDGGETGVNEEKKPLSKKARRRRSKKQAQKVAAKEKAGDAVSGNKDAGTPASKMGGLIFMCNAKTKADCYKHNIFGLPESKKDVVAKVYKGMPLFLYDFDLKLLYGIYRATGAGGYNLEPKAFNSAFPAQVRFAVLDDCTPLAAEKFKEAIKANYYGKNKFNVQLSDEQAKGLCKLFREATKASKKKLDAGTDKTVTPSSNKLGKKRTFQNDKESFRKPETKKRRIVKPVRRPIPPRVEYVLPRGRDIHERVAYMPPHYSHTVPEPVYVREPVYAPESGYAQHSLPPSYAYDRPERYDYYRREEPQLEIPSYILPDSRPDPGYRYTLVREPAPYSHYPGSSGLPASYALPTGRRY